MLPNVQDKPTQSATDAKLRMLGRIETEQHPLQICLPQQVNLHFQHYCVTAEAQLACKALAYLMSISSNEEWHQHAFCDILKVPVHEATIALVWCRDLADLDH